jgi:hypothetical protein
MTATLLEYSKGHHCCTVLLQNYYSTADVPNFAAWSCTAVVGRVTVVPEELWILNTVNYGLAADFVTILWVTIATNNVTRAAGIVL